MIPELFADHPENERDDNRDDDTGGDGEENGEVLTLHVDVAGELAQPGELAGEHQNRADNGDQAPQYEKCSAEISHYQPFCRYRSFSL